MIRVSRFWRRPVAVAALGLAASPAVADTIVQDGGWDVFEFGGVGSPVFDQQNNIDFTFTLTSSSTLRITDGYFDGDQFDVIINGIDQGATSTPTSRRPTSATRGRTLSRARHFSHASYDLGPGSYDVEAYMLQSPYGAGAGAFSLGVLPPRVPEPATWGLMLVGFAAVGFAARRRQRGLPPRLSLDSVGLEQQKGPPRGGPFSLPRGTSTPKRLADQPARADLRDQLRWFSVAA